MRYWEDMDVAETASAMGCSEGAALKRTAPAQPTLATALKSKGNYVMNEQHFAYKVKTSQSWMHGLPASTTDRLCRRAPARVNLRAVQKANGQSDDLTAAGSFVQHHFENLRVRQLLATLALAACVVSSAFWLGRHAHFRTRRNR